MTWSLETRLELLAGTVSGRQLAAGAAPWLCQPLVRTNVARERLHAWCRAGGIVRPTPSLDEIVDRLAYVGARANAAPIVLALQVAAPPARDYALDHVQFVGVDRDESGLCVWSSKQPRKELLNSIIVRSNADGSDTAFARLVALHEISHCWLERKPSADENRRTLQARGSAPYCAEDVPVELRAWALAEAWHGAPLGELWSSIRRLLRQSADSNQPQGGGLGSVPTSLHAGGTVAGFRQMPDALSER